VTLARLRQAFNRTRARLRALTGFPLYGLLFAAGAFSALAHAPSHIQPALILGLVLLVWSLDDARRTARPLRAGFARAWWFAAGQFLAGTYWVASAFLVSAEDHAWLIWAPLTLLPGGLALFWAAAGAVYARLTGSGPGRIALFAALFIAVEFARSVVLSGFPWNLPGHVFEAGGAISQSASVIGALGLSAVSLYAFASPAALKGRGGAVARAYPLTLSVLVLAGLWFGGADRLSRAEVRETDTILRVVQLDRPQAELRPSQAAEILDEYLALTLSEGFDGIDLVIWPEGSIPAFLQNEPRLLERLHAGLPAGARLVAGAPHVVWSPLSQPEAVHKLAPCAFDR
jgi:apolipoprotein N-acyltransferase